MPHVFPIKFTPTNGVCPSAAADTSSIEQAPSRSSTMTMCGMLGQTGTDVRHAEDCAACHQARTERRVRCCRGVPALTYARAEGS